MKPLKLVMEGFGSYLKRTEIDFTEFNSSLFLITGLTGGGKTTILDAICFALYGKATGGLRSWEEMRSIAADISTPTLVDFTFSIGEKTYRFCRSQHAYTGRKDGLTKIKTENSCYELKAEGETLLATGADRNINSKAQELLGLDCEQFSKVMILPQGEFRRLLLAPSVEKSKLLEKLFNAEQWSKITDKAVAAAAESKKQAEEIAAKRSAVLSSFGCENNDELEGRACAAQKKHAELEKLALELGGKLKKIEGELEALKAREEASKQLIIARESLDRAVKSKESAEAEYHRAKKELEALPEIQEATVKLHERIKSLEQALENIKAVSDLKSSLNACSKDLEKNEKTSLELTRKGNQISQRLKNGEEYIGNLRKDIEKIPAAMAKLQTLKEVSEGYSKLSSLKSELETAQKRADISASQLNSLRSELEALKEGERSLDEKLRGNMALYLSASLSDGKPCPVCGSLSHPSPASHAKSDEQGLEQKQQELKNLIQKKEAQCSNKLAEHSADTATVENIQKSLAEQEKICSGYNIYYKTFKRDLQSQTESLNALKLSSSKLPEAEKLLEKLKAAFEENRLSAERLSEVIMAHRAEQIKLKEQLKLLLEQGGLEDEEKTTSELNSARAKKTELEKTASQLQNNFTEAQSVLKSQTAIAEERHSKLKEIQTKLSICEKACENIEAESAENAEKICAEIRIQLNQAYSLGGEAKKESESLNSALTLLKKHGEKAKAAEALYSSTQRLSDMLRGNNPMKVPIKMFVLGMMLDDILLQANKYFAILSESRYSLEKITEEQGGRSLRGLDLEVFDGNYGGCRRVYTLSGGEMFLASLSLAFGLSDVVQSYSGGIRLDSIFIDEGFGSLDNETIQTAMKALHKINGMGRTVGIISHVSQLRERIGNKIVVSTDKNGSHAVIVTE